MVYNELIMEFDEKYTADTIEYKLFPAIQNKYKRGEIWAALLHLKGESLIHVTKVATHVNGLTLEQFKDILTEGCKDCGFNVIRIEECIDMEYDRFIKGIENLLPESKRKIIQYYTREFAEAVKKDPSNQDSLENGKPKEPLHLMPKDLGNELARIYRTRPNEFIGYPCIYVMPYDTTNNDAIVSMLMGALYKNNRLRSRYVYRDTCVSSPYSVNSVENELITDSFLESDISSDVAPIESGHIKYTMRGISMLSHFRQLFIASSRPRDFWITICRKYGINCVYIDCNDDSISPNSDECRNFIKDFIKSRFPDIEITEELVNDTENEFTSDAAANQRKISKTTMYRGLNNYFKNIYPLKKSFSEYYSLPKVVENFSKGSAVNQLNSLIGLSGIKNDIKSILNTFLYSTAISKNALVLENRNMIFTGNPGTCKTTIARLLSSILYQNGIIPDNSINEVGRQELVGKYVGWTARLVQEAYEDAEGGILFIDEAYSLSEDKGGYGAEAINTIVQCMENYRDRVITIFAGYPDKMQAFLETNPGLKSRIGFYVNFPNYSLDELCLIFKKMVKDRGLKVTPTAVDEVRKTFEIKMRSKDFGNGRFVRNVLDKVIANHSNRMVEKYDDLFKAPKTDMLTLRKEDMLNLDIKEIVIENSSIGFN